MSIKLKVSLYCTFIIVLTWNWPCSSFQTATAAAQLHGRPRKALSAVIIQPLSGESSPVTSSPQAQIHTQPPLPGQAPMAPHPDFAPHLCSTTKARKSKTRSARKPKSAPARARTSAPAKAVKANQPSKQKIKSASPKSETKPTINITRKKKTAHAKPKPATKKAGKKKLAKKIH